MLERSGRLDVLVNNAGVLRAGALEDLTEVLASLTYHKNWFGKDLVAEVREAYTNLKLTGVIDASTDPEEISNRITLDILA